MLPINAPPRHKAAQSGRLLVLEQSRVGQRCRRQLPNVYISCNALPFTILCPPTRRVDLGRPRIGAHVLLPSSDHQNIMEK